MTDDDLEDALRRMEERFGVAQPGSVREWVEEQVEAAFGEDFEFRVCYDEVDHDGEVCIMDDPDGFSSVWVPAADVPEWVDLEEDLPVIA